MTGTDTAEAATASANISRAFLVICEECGEEFQAVTRDKIPSAFCGVCFPRHPVKDAVEYVFVKAGPNLMEKYLRGEWSFPIKH